MERETKFYPVWKLTELEQTLDEWSERGYQVVSAGFRKRSYEPGGTPCRHRIGRLDARKQSADYITYVAAQQNAGWELICEEGNWFFFRKSCDKIEKDGDDRLIHDRDSVRVELARRVQRAESLRRVELVIAAILLVVGYATVNWIIRLAAIPLALVLAQTYYIKFLDQTFLNDDK